MSTYTIFGKELSMYHMLRYPGGFVLEEGGDVAIQYKHKPEPRLIRNYRLMLGWIWVDAEVGPDGTTVETNGDRSGPE